MKKLKTLLLATLICVSTALFGACTCNEEPPPEVDLDYNKNGIIEEWEEEYQALDRPTNRTELEANAVSIYSLDDLLAINDNFEDTTTVYKLACDIDCDDEVVSIALRNNILLGNNFVIKNFLLDVNNPNNGGTVALISGNNTPGECNAKVYDLRVYGKIQNIPVSTTHNPILPANNISMFYNLHTLDNVTTKASFNIAHDRQDGDNLNYMVTASTMANYCRYVNNCTAIGLLNYTETPGYSTGTKVFAGIDPVNGVDLGMGVDRDYSIKNCTSKVTMNIYSESITEIAGITCNSIGDLYNNTVDATASINYTTYDTIPESPTYKNVVSIAGICSAINNTSEIRNNKFNGRITAKSTLNDGDAPQANAKIAALANQIDGGILTFNEIRGKIEVENIKYVDAAAYSNSSINALYHYNICTTDISIDNAKTVKASQFSTNLEYGLVDSLLIDSDVYVNSEYVDSEIYTAMFSIMNTYTESIEPALPNLYKVICMGHMSFRIPSENMTLYYKNGLCADTTNHTPILYSQNKVFYIEDEFSLKRITPSNTGIDVVQDILDEATSVFAEEYINSIPSNMLGYQWLFGTNFGISPTYVDRIDTTLGYEPNNFYFKNIADTHYFSERNNLNIFNNVRYDYYLDGTYTADINDEFYCILASKIKAVDDLGTGEIFAVGLDNAYIEYIKTKFKKTNIVDAIVATIEDMTMKTEGRDTQLISCTNIVKNPIQNGNNDTIGVEIKLIGEKTTTIKIDTHMIENGVNYISIVISKSNNI